MEALKGSNFLYENLLLIVQKIKILSYKKRNFLAIVNQDFFYQFYLCALNFRARNTTLNFIKINPSFEKSSPSLSLFVSIHPTLSKSGKRRHQTLFDKSADTRRVHFLSNSL